MRSEGVQILRVNTVQLLTLRRCLDYLHSADIIAGFLFSAQHAGKNFSRRHFKIFSFPLSLSLSLSQKTEFNISCKSSPKETIQGPICMICQGQFSRHNQQNANELWVCRLLTLPRARVSNGERPRWHSQMGSFSGATRRNYYFTHTQENLDKIWVTPKGKNLQIPLRADPMLKKQNNNLGKKHVTLQPLYNTVCYNTVLDITRFKDGSQKCIDYIEKWP